jgi:cytochrome c
MDMWRQPRLKGQQESTFFADGSAMRLPVSGTVAKGHFEENEVLSTGFETDAKGVKKLTATIPMQITPALLKRGQERYNIFCTPCHGKVGDGNGMISQRGFALRRPPGNYHTERLQKMPVGHFYDVITNGYGAMFSYASRIQDVKDRWAIVAYIRVLQQSQNATPSDVKPEDRAKLEASTESGSPETKRSEGH